LESSIFSMGDKCKKDCEFSQRLRTKYCSHF